jgi:dimethylglycine dehydrogenase
MTSKGALYDPADGDIDPAQLTQALAKGARDLGATILRFCPATGVSRENGEWIIHTEKGDIRCEIVVNAAGYYAQRVGEWFKPFGGRTVPMMVMSHQYMIFDEVPAVRDWSEEVGHKLPLLRDVDVSYYLRQEKNGFNLGPYERPCKAHWADPSDPLPEDFSFQLYPDALDRLSVQIEDSMARVPVLAEAGLAKTINGPIPYAPDGNPLIGPMPGVPNAFEACVFTFGIAQGGGAGKVLAEWITEGRRPNGTCGPATRAASPTTPITTTASPRGWRSTATNTACISRGTAGPRHRTASSPPSMTG